jgi:hypothetical protein
MSKKKILLLCHDLTTRLGLSATWSGAGVEMLADQRGFAGLHHRRPWPARLAGRDPALARLHPQVTASSPVSPPTTTRRSARRARPAQRFRRAQLCRPARRAPAQSRDLTPGAPAGRYLGPWPGPSGPDRAGAERPAPPAARICALPAQRLAIGQRWRRASRANSSTSPRRSDFGLSCTTRWMSIGPPARCAIGSSTPTGRARGGRGGLAAPATGRCGALQCRLPAAGRRGRGRDSGGGHVIAQLGRHVCPLPGPGTGAAAIHRPDS